MAKLLYQGHGSLRLTTEAGTVVYLDPFLGEGYDRPADLILVTHQHPDHTCLELPARKPGCRVIQNMDALRDGVYRSFELDDVRIEAVEAYNRNHPKDACVGYVVTADGRQIYFAGDTGPTEQMKALAARKLDYAFLPVDGFYNMGPEEAAECARIIGAKCSVPIHTVRSEERRFSRQQAERFQTPGARIVEPGEELEL